MNRSKLGRRGGECSVILGIVVLFVAYINTGWPDLFEYWNVPIMKPAFADLRTITHGADAAAIGVDPMIENNFDPWSRRLNYPRVWQLLYPLGVNKSHTETLGFLLVVLYFGGMLLVFRGMKLWWSPVLILFVLAPAGMLAIERGNIDIAVFFILCLAAVLYTRNRRNSAAVAILLTVMLKIYPVFSIGIMNWKDGRDRVYLILLLIASICYFALIYEDLTLIARNTPAPDSLSYGISVITIKFGKHFPEMYTLAKIIAYAGVGSMLLGSLWCIKRGRAISSRSENRDVLFIIGSSIYIGTFLLGANFDYRLIFLAFVLPNLLTLLTFDRLAFRLYGMVMLALILITTWYLILRNYMDAYFVGPLASTIVDEVAHWLLFGGLLFRLLSMYWQVDSTRGFRGDSERKIA